MKSRVRDEARALYRKAILDAAELVFAERGVHVARVQDIAARAGLSVGVIYNYFEQKEDVLFALLGERMAGILEEFEPKADDPRPFEEALVARVTRFLQYSNEHQAFFQVASEHGLIGPGNAGGEALLGGKKLPNADAFAKAVTALVDAGIAKGALAPIDRELLTLQLRHTLKSASLWRRTHPGTSVAETAKLAVALFLRGAGGSGKKPRR